MLTAEKKVIRQNKKGFSHYEWIKQGGARNEAIDVFCYSRAALRIAYSNDSKTLEKLAMREPWAMENAIPKTADTVTARETRAAPVKKKNRSIAPRNERARAQGIII